MRKQNRFWARSGWELFVWILLCWHWGILAFGEHPFQIWDLLVLNAFNQYWFKVHLNLQGTAKAQKQAQKHGSSSHTEQEIYPESEGQNSTTSNILSSAPAGKAWKKGGCFCQSLTSLCLPFRYHLSGILARHIPPSKGREQDYFIKWLRHCMANATITLGLIWNGKREVKLSQHRSPRGEEITLSAKISTLPHE